jgi:hypothetical protein
MNRLVELMNQDLTRWFFGRHISKKSYGIGWRWSGNPRLVISHNFIHRLKDYLSLFSSLKQMHSRFWEANGCGVTCL